MKLVLFDNTSGFRPTGKVLEYWKFLPQTQIDADAPSLYGNLKSMLIPYLMVIILVLCEVGLFFTLQEAGVSFMTLLALSIFDFVVAILPAVVFIYGNLILSVIKANIYITESNIKINNNIPTEFKNNAATYKNWLEARLKKFDGQKRLHFLIEFALAGGIIALTTWKFMSLYEVFGNDIFVLGEGRFVIVVLILSLITHVFFTKIVFAHMIFSSALNAQKKAFTRGLGNAVGKSDTNKKKVVTFHSEFNPEHSSNQFVAELLSDEDAGKYKGKSDVKIVEHSNGRTEVFAIKEIINQSNVFIVYTGLLTEPELVALAAAQPEATSKQAILAIGKQIQLEQN